MKNCISLFKKREKQKNNPSQMPQKYDLKYFFSPASYDHNFQHEIPVEGTITLSVSSPFAPPFYVM